MNRFHRFCVGLIAFAIGLLLLTAVSVNAQNAPTPLVNSLVYEVVVPDNDITNPNDLRINQTVKMPDGITYVWRGESLWRLTGDFLRRNPEVTREWYRRGRPLDEMSIRQILVDTVPTYVGYVPPRPASQPATTVIQREIEQVPTAIWWIMGLLGVGMLGYLIVSAIRRWQEPNYYPPPAPDPIVHEVVHTYTEVVHHTADQQPLISTEGGDVTINITNVTDNRGVDFDVRDLLPNGRHREPAPVQPEQEN